MKDPERIKEMLELVNQIWTRDPNLRFNQLLYILQTGYSQKNNSVGQIKEIESDGFIHIGFDFFNIEDSQFIKYLRGVASNENSL